MIHIDNPFAFAPRVESMSKRRNTSDHITKIERTIETQSSRSEPYPSLRHYVSTFLNNPSCLTTTFLTMPTAYSFPFAFSSTRIVDSICSAALGGITNVRFVVDSQKSPATTTSARATVMSRKMRVRHKKWMPCSGRTARVLIFYL